MVGEYNLEQAEELIKLAREVIKSRFSEEKIEMPEGAEFKQARGVFVTLKKDNKLRGCIGFPYPEIAISEAVMQAARSAAFSDPRFPPVIENEIDKIIIEISILTTPQDVKDVKEIEIGKDGLMCDCMGYSGLLLPQVATEHKMSKVEFLECLCDKAGLPRDSWQKDNFKLQKFQAQIFSEEEPNGKVREEK